MNKAKYKHHILFLDDEEKSVKYFQKLFGDCFKVIATTNPHEALKIVSERSEEIAVFVSDQRMPGFSGVDLLAKIKERNRNIVTVLTTAYASLENNIEAINKGNVFAYLTKPWNIEEVKLLLTKALDEFSARQSYVGLSGSIAHEMRNPLNNVRQSSRLIKEKLSNAHLNERICGFGDEKITPILKQDFHEIISSLELVENTVKRGNAIIDIILSSIGGNSTNSLENENITASEILRKTLQEYAFREGEKERVLVNIDPSEDFLIRCEESSLIYVFFNLIKNSLYYTSSHPDLKIIISAKKNEHGQNIILFRDNGPGIPKDTLNNLFSAFTTFGKKEGTGLGLAFCKRVLSELGGSIGCNSEVSVFTEFALSFPPIDEKNKSDQKFNKILLIDEESAANTKKLLLEEKLHITKCDIANTEDETKKLLKNNQYNAIIIDIERSQYDGVELVKNIREFDYATPILAYLSEKNVIKSGLGFRAINGQISRNSSDLAFLKMVSKWSLIKIVDKPKIVAGQDFLSQKRILVVDDEEINLIVTTKYLSKYQAKIDNAKSGLVALEMIRNNEYDVVLMDIQMPELTGLETIEEIRKQFPLSKSAIVAVTGDSSKSQIHKILNSGFDDYFIKGNSYDELLAIIDLL